MSGVTPIDQIAGGLQQAFKVFVENYKAPEATRTWGDYLFQPAALVSDLTALVTGVRSQEHDLQKKFFEELKQTLDQSFGEKQTSFQVIFFNYLVAFKLIERLNRSVLEYLGGTGPDGKSVPQKTVAGINFVRFYDEYSKSVSEITKGYSLRVADLLKVIDQHISPEDFEKILKAPSEKAGEKTGGAFFEVLLARLEEALWTPEQQRAFGIEFSELAGAAGALQASGGPRRRDLPEWGQPVRWTWLVSDPGRCRHGPRLLSRQGV